MNCYCNNSGMFVYVYLQFQFAIEQKYYAGKKHFLLLLRIKVIVDAFYYYLSQ